MHELCLHDLFLDHLLLANNDPAGYAARLNAVYGEVGTRILKKFGQAGSTGSSSAHIIHSSSRHWKVPWESSSIRARAGGPSAALAARPSSFCPCLTRHPSSRRARTSRKGPTRPSRSFSRTPWCQ